MKRFLRTRLSMIEAFFSKLPAFSRPEKNSLAYLNGAQFLGALNDNIYKLVLAFFLIGLGGPRSASTVLATAGALFVIPFLLFSSAAGILADRFSKSRLIIVIKGTEILIFLFAILAFYLKSQWAGYTLLFLLSSHSAMFGPSKFGIIPELVPEQKVSKANGLIVSFTYLAVIIGTFLASFLTDITNRNYILVASFCLIIAIGGFVSSFGIKYTPPRGSEKKISPFFLKQIFQTLRECRDRKHLLIAIAGSSYFLFIGGFTQLNIIPFAMDSLGLSEVAGGYLFLTSALGIAVGAQISGFASKKRIELALTCLAGALISLFFFILSSSTASLSITLVSLFAIGFAGGNFVVPFDSYIQIASPEKNRGHVIAATNIFSFVGVLIASVALYLFSEVLGLSPAAGFALVGALTALFTLLLFLRLSDQLLSYSAKKLLFPWIHIHTEGIELLKRREKPILMLEKGSFFKGWILTGMIPNLSLLFPQYKVRRFPYFENLFYSLHRIEAPEKYEPLIDQGKRFFKAEVTPCISLMRKRPVPNKETSRLLTLFQKENYVLVTVTVEKVEPRTYLIRFRG